MIYKRFRSQVGGLVGLRPPGDPRVGPKGQKSGDFRRTRAERHPKTCKDQVGELFGGYLGVVWGLFELKNPIFFQGRPSASKGPQGWPQGSKIRGKKNVPNAIPIVGPRPPKLGANVPTALPERGKSNKYIKNTSKIHQKYVKNMGRPSASKGPQGWPQGIFNLKKRELYS